MLWLCSHGAEAVENPQYFTVVWPVFDANVTPVFTIVRAGRTISCVCSLACGLPLPLNVENGETVSSFSHARCMGLDVEDLSWLR